MRTRILLMIIGLIIVAAASQKMQAMPLPVTTCGQTLSAADEYLLTNDLNCTSPSGDNNGVVITAGNVVFHLAGHTISSGNCDLSRNISGIFVAGGITGVKIDGGAVTGFNDGILLASSNSRVEGMTVRNACVFGILVGGERNQVETNFVTGSGDGVALVPARFTQVSSNDLSGNVRAGVAISDFSQNNIVENNILNNNGGSGEGYGVAIFNGTYNIIRNNAANHNDFGIRVSQPNNAINGNTVSGNSNLGIWILTTGAPSSVRRNTVFGSGNTDMFDESAGCVGNIWRNNNFMTDLVAGVSDSGPGAGCLR